MSLQEIMKEITEETALTAETVASLKTEMLADGVIDRAECDALFNINDLVSSNTNDSSWSEFFVSAIASHIMEDGVIDAEETAYLVDKIKGDGVVDATETALIQNLQASASEFPSELAELIA